MIGKMDNSAIINMEDEDTSLILPSVEVIYNSDLPSG